MNSALLLSQLVLVVGNQNVCTYATNEHTHNSKNTPPITCTKQEGA